MDMSAVPLPEQPPADPYLVGGNLAMWLNAITDLAPDAYPALYYTNAIAAVASTSTQFHLQLGVSSLLTVVVHEGHSYVCTSVDDAGNVIFGQAQCFVYAIWCYAKDGSPAWTISLALQELIEGGPGLRCLQVGLPLPAMGIIWGGRDGMLISPGDPTMEEALTELLTIPGKYPAAKAYIARITHTPPELCLPFHQDTLDR
jgi:hypothetical protein